MATSRGLWWTLPSQEAGSPLGSSEQTRLMCISALFFMLCHCLECRPYARPYTQITGANTIPTIKPSLSLPTRLISPQNTSVTPAEPKRLTFFMASLCERLCMYSSTESPQGKYQGPVLQCPVSSSPYQSQNRNSPHLPHGHTPNHPQGAPCYPYSPMSPLHPQGWVFREESMHKC